MIFQRSAKNIFFYLAILVGFFILLEISFALEAKQAYFGAFKLVANHLEIPARVLPGILWFIAAQLFINFCWLIATFLIVIGVSEALNLPDKSQFIATIGIWFFSLFLILLSNQVFFPNSMFSIFITNKYYLLILHSLLNFGLGILTVLILTAVVGWIKVSWYGFSRLFLILIVSLLVIDFISLVESTKVVTDHATTAKPNIILIGFDSLRPDFLGFNGATLKTTNFNNFMNEATVFSNSITPLARTWPSWISILTGQSPETTNAKTNLLNPDLLSVQSTLPTQLKNIGYETVFATDESRFSNIDESNGFDKIFSPNMGFNDFLLGTLNDFPLSNLLVNTAVGRYLFPWSFANRAAYVTYNPHSFLQKISPLLNQSRTKPLFLAIHFCLPHYPYVWANLPIGHGASVNDYRFAIERSDLQFKHFMQLLKDNNLLQHSIVVLLSDHGEALELPGDRVTDKNFYLSNKKIKTIPKFYPPSAYHEKINTSGGHGTDVLGFVQYHTVLAVRGYGITGLQAGKIISDPVALIDIKPTLLDYLNIPQKQTDGVSLLPNLQGKTSLISSQRDLFVESDFSPEAVRSVHPETRKVLFEGIEYFQIDPLTTRIRVRDTMLQMILSSKQYADYRDKWVLAIYPRSSNERILVLVNLATGEWTTDFMTPFAIHSPVKSMLKSLNEHFKL